MIAYVCRFSCFDWLTYVEARSRNGHVVIALIPESRSGDCKPCVGLVTSTWMTVKKPKLATSGIPIDHAVAIRIIQMVRMHPESPEGWECNNDSLAWVVQPHSVVAVLDLDGFQQETERCWVRITQKSCTLVDQMQSISQWWPAFQEDGQPQTKNPHHLLYVHRQGRRRAVAKAKAKAQVVHVFKKRVRKAKKKPSVPEETQNFKRTTRGSTLIKQMMEKVKGLDCAQFPTSPVFSSQDDKCLISSCAGIPWSTFLEKAPLFFRTESLGLRSRVGWGWKAEFQ
eukprot:Skav209119  [mRNA]  locus=scaffold179:407350:408198:+ [translate_table: standard]